MSWRAWSRAAVSAAVSLAVAPAAAEVRKPPFAYNATVAGLLGSLAEVSYCGPLDKMLSWTCDPCLKSGIAIVPGSVRQILHEEFMDKGSVFAYVAAIQAPEPLAGGCVLSVRGTEKVSNWMVDAEFWLSTLPIGWCEDPSCSVTRGFWAAWQGIEQMVVGNLTEIGCGPGSAPVHVTGHSLGAAMGTIGTWALQRLGFKVGMSYSFASPRVGNAAFAAAFDSAVGSKVPFFRVNFGRDAVVHLPPAGLGYQHVQSEVFYEAMDSPARICDGAEDPECADRYYVFNPSDHCRSVVVPSSDICDCPGWVSLNPPTGLVFV